MHAVQDRWYVQVNGQAYGPYNSVQMQGFCTEGRVNETSMISQSAAQGYAPALQFKSFLQWTGRLQTITPHETQSLQRDVPVQQQASAAAQVLRPISAPQTGVLARQLAPVGYAPEAIAPNPTPIQKPVTQPSPKTVFVIMAEIRSENGMAFLQALQAQGTAQRIGDSVWLLQSERSVEQLRNTLSQTLTGDDRLFLLDSFANNTAWFNIGTSMDSKIRELWDLTN